MGVGIIDIIVFVIFVVVVIGIGLWQSRNEEIHGEHGAQDYFLAGRGLTWWLVGFSLIAANISTEQFVGMSGKAADWLGARSGLVVQCRTCRGRGTAITRSLARVAASVASRAPALPLIAAICMEPTARKPIRKIAMPIITSTRVNPSLVICLVLLVTFLFNMLLPFF